MDNNIIQNLKNNKHLCIPCNLLQLSLDNKNIYQNLATCWYYRSDYDYKSDYEKLAPSIYLLPIINFSSCGCRKICL